MLCHHTDEDKACNASSMLYWRHQQLRVHVPRTVQLYSFQLHVNPLKCCCISQWFLSCCCTMTSRVLKTKSEQMVKLTVKHKPARVVAHTFNYLGDVIMPGDDNREDAKLAEKWTFTTQYTQFRCHIGIALTPIHQLKLVFILTEPRLANIHNLQQHLD